MSTAKNLSLLLLLVITFTSQAQKKQLVSYTFKDPVVNVNFGTGEIGDRSSGEIPHYRFVPYSCPSDGRFTYASSTADCFRGDWHTLPEDHTPGDADGNMMIVNSSYTPGTFMTTTVSRLKPGTTYEFSVWCMNLCKPTPKCPFPLLPEVVMSLQSGSGKVQAELATGELTRKTSVEWTRYQVIFTTPSEEGPLTLTMVNNKPGGCGNDFVMDDISFRERVETKIAVANPPKAPVKVPAKTKTPVKPPVVVVKKTIPVPEKPVVKKEVPPVVVVTKTIPPPEKSVVKKEVPPVLKKPAEPAPKPKPPVTTVTENKKAPAPLTKEPVTTEVAVNKEVPVEAPELPKPKPPVFAPAPPILRARSNPLIKTIEADPGDIKLDLYDNGQIDGDTISVYHNNELVVSHARLSVTPITLHIKMDPEHPHHELVLVAHNLGSIPPNTSLMIINAGGKRYEVFISSTEQKNAKVVIDLRQ